MISQNSIRTRCAALLESSRLKRLMFAALLGITVFIAGCTQTSPDNAAKLPVADLPADQVHGRITVWSWNTAAQSLRELTPSFQRHDPGARVTIDMTGARMATRLMLSLAAGVGAPDVSQLLDTDAPHYIATRQLVDLTSVAAPYRTLFPRAVWDNCVFHGRVYAIPWDMGPCAVFYKRRIFARYGVDPAKILTWDDYIKAGQEILRKSGGRTKMLPLGSDDMETMFELLIQQTGGQVFDDQGRIAIDSLPAKQALDIIQRLRGAGICSDIAAYGQEWMAGFNDESIATYPGAFWLGGTLKDTGQNYGGKQSDWGVFPLPAIVLGGPRVANLGGSVLVIPTQCRDKAAAWAFIRYALCTREGQLAQYRSSNLFPAFLPALQTAEIDKPDPFFGGQRVGQLFATDVSKITPLNRTAYWSEATGYIGQALSHWAATGMPNEDVFSSLSRKLQRRLDVPLAPQQPAMLAAGERQ